MWFMSVYNQSTMTYVIDPQSAADEVEGHATRDAAKRELQEWLMQEANECDADDAMTADMLDDAAQQLNYADVAYVGSVCSWLCETVEIV